MLRSVILNPIRRQVFCLVSDHHRHRLETAEETPETTGPAEASAEHRHQEDSNQDQQQQQPGKYLQQHSLMFSIGGFGRRNERKGALVLPKLQSRNGGRRSPRKETTRLLKRSVRPIIVALVRLVTWDDSVSSY